MDESYYIVIPGPVRASKAISSTSKLLYGEIMLKCNNVGYCWAKNEYLADLMGIEPRTIQRLVKELETANFIRIELIVNPAKGTERKIYLTDYQGDNNVVPGGNVNVVPGVTEVAKGGDIIVIPGATLLSEGGDKNVAFNNKIVKKNKGEIKLRSKKGKLQMPALPPGVDEIEIYNLSKKIFQALYLKECQSGEYYFTAVDGRKLYSILNKVLFKVKEKNSAQKEITEISQPDFMKAVTYFFTYGYKHGSGWIKSNFTLTNIDQQFNSIYTAIVNGHEQTNTGNNRGNNGGGRGHASNQDIIKSIYNRNNKQ